MRIHFGGKEYDFTPPLRLREAIVIKQALGLTIDDFDRGMASTDPVAWQAMAWVVRSRAGEAELDPRTIDFDTDTWWIEAPPQQVGQGEPAANGDRPPVAAAPEGVPSPEPPPSPEPAQQPASSTTPPSEPSTSA